MIIDKEFKSIISPLTSDEYQGLEKKLLSEGCRENLIAWKENDVLIDGHNRYEICQKHNIPYQLKYLSFEDRTSVKIWIIKNQLGRRNITDYQRAELALKLEPMIAEKAKENQLATLKQNTVLQNSVEREPIDTQKELARVAGVSHDTIHKVKIIQEKAIEPLKEKARSGGISINTASAIAEAPKEEQKVIVQLSEKEILEKARKIRQQKREERDQKEAEAKKVLARQPIPITKYQTIVIDPPWPIQKIIRDCRPNQVEFDYPTMTIDEIKAFPINKIAHDNCHLYLWTTHKFLPAAFEIVNYWGFNYECLLTWVKNVGFTPFSWMYSTEHVLFCRRGSLEVMRKGLRLDFQAKVREHSRKPDEFYQLVTQASPGPRIDVFSREKRDDFEQYGNEAEKFQNRQAMV